MTAAAGRLRQLVPLWLLFVVPLAYLKAANDYVIQPKWNLVAIAGWAWIGAAGVWPALRGGGRHPLLPAWGAWFAALCVSALGALNGWQAGRLLLEQAALIALAMLVAGGAANVDRLLMVCGVTVACLMRVAVDQAQGIWNVGHGEQFGAGRLYATLGNPSFFGVYLAPVAVWSGVVAALDAARGDRRRAGVRLTVLLVVLWLMARAAVMDAWAGLGLGAAVAAWLLYAQRRASPFRSLGIAGAVLAVGVLVTGVALAPRLHDRLDYLRVKAFSWHAAAWLWRDHPVLGAGPGGFQSLAPQVMTRVHALWTGPWGVRETLVAPHDEAFAHQDLLQMLAEQGAVGFGLWCWIVAIAVRIGWGAVRAGDRGRVALLAGVAAAVPTMFLHFPLHLAPSALVFWLGLGWLAAKEGPASAAPATWPGRVAFAVVGLAACVWIVRGLTTNVLVGEGYRMLRGGAPQLAIGFFQRAERLDAHHFEERFYAGAAYQAVKDEGAAIDAYGRALALYPGMLGARYNLGNVYFGRRDYATAARIYAEVVAIDPTHLDAINNLGNSLALQDRHAEARHWYLRALSLRPDFPEALYNLSVNAWKRNDRADARRWLAKALAADPTYPPAREFAASLGLKP